MKHSDSDIAPIRTSEDFDNKKLSDYLIEHLPTDILDASSSRSIEFAQFPSGHSNLTYLVKIGEQEF
ncbi:MAG TPA: phosphotransferase family protein, partial [Blastocatellia bacterium]|nr:phosphotransferase family protein [Blastocatellia bacterium]